MFRISVVDHIRLNFDRTSQNYTLHARAAERLAVTTARIRIGVLILLAIAAVSAATSLAESGRAFQIAAAITAGIAFAAHAAYLASASKAAYTRTAPARNAYGRSAIAISRCSARSRTACSIARASSSGATT